MMKKATRPLILVFSLLLLILSNSLLAQHQNALDFDGIDDAVETTGALSLIAGSTTLSMTCWVYPTNPNPIFPDFDGFCGFRNDFDADFYFTQIGPATIEARFRGSDGISRDIVYAGLVLNSWNHFGLVHTGSYVKLYHNGLLVDSVSSASPITNTAGNFFIGTLPYFSNDYRLTGKMDEVSLWSRALDESEMDCIYRGGINPQSSDLKMYYTFNQGISGGTNTNILALQDFSQSLQNATLSGFGLIGTVSNFVDGTQTYPVTAVSLCQGESYQFGSQILNTSGNYLEGFSTGGCDSISQLILTVAPLSLSVTVNNETLTADQVGATYQWLDCDNGNAAILNANSQSYSPALNGNYSVIVTLNTCSDTSQCVMLNSVGISNQQFSKEVSIYPNPFSEKLNIDLSGSLKEFNIEVFNMQGLLIYQSLRIGGSIHQISIGDWAEGIYLMKVSDGDSYMIRSLIKGF